MLVSLFFISNMMARTVLVTGSSRGLGLEMVRLLAQHNTPPDVIIATCRNPEAAQVSNAKIFMRAHTHKGKGMNM